ncbi:helix-turn-helix domain-containing protein [Actinoplanes sp. TBRC 11911]|uniref:helix-turn-helix transcriptional regulator n=1 Tax=Actinoplanes sp. TBRC 11911 TaxID=2729386 RepID=UPI00145D1E21|nr:helix-turn-helix transcriptional regulator [Actinoplanes sp. TBRC 11911]NMO52420.1 helix-turn-helix domain-containing protein [Actinoplanes sp. TBRC 11911]
MAPHELTLGDFLRRRRASLTPRHTAPDAIARRVPGLRREEMARLVGVSVDYYVKLEQGTRRITPSGNVLHALGDVLGLDDLEREHMYDLARLDNRPRAARESAVQTVRPGTFRLMESFLGLPAILFGRRTDVLAVNPMARLLVDDFPALPARDRNGVRWAVLGERVREIQPDWPGTAQCLIGMLRMDLGRYLHDPKTIALIDELYRRSEVFREIWSRGTVARSMTGPIFLKHPEAGPMHLNVEAVRVTDDPDQTLHVMIPCPDAMSQAAMAELRRRTGPPARGPV